jgi:glyoxylase-like metal-dependent hydrolase (beta-lactamase superfamily II)
MQCYSSLPLLFAAVVAVAVTPAAGPPAGPLVVDELASGVHLFRPAEPAPDRVNSLVVERSDGLLVVGAQPSPDAARKLLAAIEARFAGTVRYLVLPHSHADAAGGATAFPKEVLVIGSLGCRDALARDDYDFGAEARVRARNTDWAEPERRAPVLLVEAKILLDDERNPVEVMPFGNGHSAGDLLVSLPRHDVYFVGALLFPDGRPYGNDSEMGKWSNALNQLVRQGPRMMLPLRGPAIDNAAVRVQRDALAWLRGQVLSAINEKLPPEEIRDGLLQMPELAERFDIDSPFLLGLIDRSIEHDLAQQRKFELRYSGGD